MILPELRGLNINNEMLARGLARVRPEEEADEAARVLLELEATARDARLGIWDHAYYAVRPAEAVSPGATGSFQIVEGVVVDAAAVSGWLYLNFGPDYRTDFTAGAPPVNGHSLALTSPIRFARRSTPIDTAPRVAPCLATTNNAA